MAAAAPTDRAGLSRRLRGIMWSSPALALLRPHGCGWIDGGCRIAADGLAAWLGQVQAWSVVDGQAWSVVDGQGRAQHLAVRYNGWWLDGDGVSSSLELIDRWTRLERVAGAGLRPIEPGVLTLPEAPLDAAASRRLAGLLEARLPAALARAILDARRAD